MYTENARRLGGLDSSAGTGRFDPMHALVTVLAVGTLPSLAC
jgi:hypothetical protein